MLEKMKKAENGIPVFSLINNNVHSFFISMFVKSGSMYEREEENGITHFLEHAAIRNVNKLMDGKLYEILDRYGMEFNASTYNEMVQFYITGNDRCFAKAAEIISMLLRPIALDRAEIDAERQRIKAEIREVNDKSTLAYFTSFEVFSNTSLARPITGTLGSVSRITGRGLEEYRRRTFTRDNLFFYVTGNVNVNDIDMLLKLVGAYTLSDGEKHSNIAPVPSNFGKRAPLVHIKNADFTKIRYTFDVDMSRVGCAELDLLYELVLGGYSSEFFIELSEKRGLFYDLGGTVERYRNIGAFSFSYELKESMLYEAAEMTMELLCTYREKIPDAERCMRSGYVDNAYMLLDDPRELNFTFGYDNHILDLGYSGLEERIRTYSVITPERIREVAREIFRPENMTITLKGNKKKINIEKLNNIIFKRG